MSTQEPFCWTMQRHAFAPKQPTKPYREQHLNTTDKPNEAISNHHQVIDGHSPHRMITPDNQYQFW